jgi:hypothetical protein
VSQSLVRRVVGFTSDQIVKTLDRPSRLFLVPAFLFQPHNIALPPEVARIEKSGRCVSVCNRSR